MVFSDSSHAATYTSVMGGQTIASRLFAVDVRALAALRIALGAIFVIDLINRFALIPELYTDTGVLPRDLVPYGPFPGPAMWGGSVAFEQAFFAVAMLAGVAMTLGRFTRVATFICWLTGASLWWRHPGFLNGGDLVLVQLLFWSLFLPMDRVWSLRAASSDDPPGGHVLSFASAGLILHMPLVYLFSVFHKIAGSGWLEGTASLVAASHDAWARPFGHFLVENLPWSLKLLTWATLGLEGLGPLLLFVPWATGRIRILVFLGFAALQTGLGFSIVLWIFPFVSMAALLPVLPSEVFDRLTGRAEGPTIDGLPVADRFKPALSVFCAVCLGYVVFSNIQRQTDWVPPKPINRAGRLLALNQGWVMYSEQANWDQRLLVRGRGLDGQVRWLDDWGQTSSWPAFEKLRESYRGRHYLLRQAGHRIPPELRGFTRWVCRTWNNGHPPGARLTEIELVAWTRTIPLDGSERETRQKVIGRRNCAGPNAGNS